MEDAVKDVLFTREEIENMVNKLGAEITRDYQDEEIMMVGILSGAVIFMADLARAVKRPVLFDFIDVSSYGDSTETSGEVRILKDLEMSVEGRHILLVEDIVDTGLTLNYLYRTLTARDPASLRICSLLNKPERRRVDVKIDYKGFDIPDEFVCGYGLDYADRYRNLPYIFVLKKGVYT